MTFTADQIAIIEQIVDRRIQAQSKRRYFKDYHTTCDIRDLIIEHLSEFQEFIGDSEFPVNVLRFFIKRKATLRAKDLEVVCEAGKSQTDRFSMQVGNAIQPAAWKDSPFEQVRPGSYRLRPDWQTR